MPTNAAPSPERATIPMAGAGAVILTLLSLLLGFEALLVPLAGLVLLFRHGLRRVPLQARLVACLIAALCVSAGLGFLRDGMPDRIASSLYSIAILCGGLLLGLGWLGACEAGAGGNPRPALVETLGRLGSRLIVACLALLAAGLAWRALTGAPALRIPTLLAPLLGGFDTEMAGYFSATRIYRADWGFVSFPVPRFIYFARWDTAGAIIVALAGNAAALRYRLSGATAKFVLAEAATTLLVLSTFSRTVIAAHLLASAALYLAVARRKLPVIAVYLVLAGAGLLAAQGLGLVDTATGFRPRSNAARLEIYAETLRLLGTVEPVLGLGYKPRTDAAAYALGSHSMILSFLVRGGLVAGVLAALAFWALPAARLLGAVRRRDPAWPFLARGLAVFAVWSLFQEVDTSMLTFAAVTLWLVLVDASRAPAAYSPMRLSATPSTRVT